MSISCGSCEHWVRHTDWWDKTSDPIPERDTGRCLRINDRSGPMAYTYGGSLTTHESFLCNLHTNKKGKTVIDESDISIAGAMNDVYLERVRQNEKWGRDDVVSHNHGIMLMILTEEVGEVAEACLGVQFHGKSANAELREELVQVAACAVKWVEAIDRGLLNGR